MIRRRHWTLPFGAGDYVVAKVDPRHVGRVRYAYATFVRVQWIESRWISEHEAAELQAAPAPYNESFIAPRSARRIA